MMMKKREDKQIVVESHNGIAFNVADSNGATVGRNKVLNNSTIYISKTH